MIFSILADILEVRGNGGIDEMRSLGKKIKRLAKSS